MEQLGKYTVIRRLGIGGMAEVYLCRLVGIGGFEKQVVVKKIRADIEADPEFVMMFFDEARLAANLSHPNIVHVFEVDQLDGTPYLAMEYVHGATLSRVLQKLRASSTPMQVGPLAYLFAAVCAGLDHAHNARDAGGRALEIVHRDISPQNIIVSFDGTPKIFDFGVAKARGSLTVTGTDRVKGKFAYMAPEQLRGKPVDAKADVYAVGVCMYEAVTGKRPFVGGSEGELLAARVEGRFKMPSEHVPTIPVELEHLILSAMAPDPADRPTALELQEALSVFYAVGSEHATNAQAIAAWLKELFEEETQEAYDTYSTAASPSVTSMPRSANLPPTSSAVEARLLRMRPRDIVIGGLVVAGIAVVAIAVTGMREDVRPPAKRQAVAAAPQPGASAPVRAQQDRRIAAVVQAQEELEEKHRRELELIRRELEQAKRDDKPPVASAKDRDDREPERKKQPVRAPVRVAAVPKAAAAKPSTKAGSGSAALGKDAGSADRDDTEVAASSAGSGSAAAGSAHVATQATHSTGGGSAVAPARIAKPVTPPVVAAQPRDPGSLDAKPLLAGLAVDGSLTTTEVQSALARTFDVLQGCYRTAARRANQTPDVSVRVSFEIDEGARARRVRTSGDALGLGDCVREALGGVRTRMAPDVGTVSVSAVIRFKPIR